jgi:hypothetical protein
MILKLKAACSVRFDKILWNTDIFGWASENHVILDQDSVLKNSNSRGCKINGSVIAKSRSRINDIIGLPFTRLPANVDKGSMLLVKASRLPLTIGAIVVAIKNLDFK